MGARISVIIPTWQRAALLGDAVASVRRQSVPVHEIVVVDDGSSDGTRAIATSLGPDVRYAWQENQGPAAARNLGLELASGDVIAFLDSDDLFDDAKLAIQTALLERHPGADMVWGRARNVIFSPADGDLAPAPQDAVCWQLGSMLFRRSLFQRVGGFEPSLRHWEDVDLVIRVREAGLSVVEHPDVVLLRRLHEGSLSWGLQADHEYVVRTMKLRLDRARRRAAADRAARSEPR